MQSFIFENTIHICALIFRSMVERLGSIWDLNRILVSGSMTGCTAAFQTTNVLMELNSYVPWSAILALLLSVIVHWPMRLWQDAQSLNEELEIGRIPTDLIGRCYQRKSKGAV